MVRVGNKNDREVILGEKRLRKNREVPKIQGIVDSNPTLLFTVISHASVGSDCCSVSLR